MITNDLWTGTAGRGKVRRVRDGMKGGHGTWTRGERRHRAIARLPMGSLSGAVNTVT